MAKTIRFWSLFVLMLLSMYSCNERPYKAKEKLALKKQSLQTKIGDKFVIGNILDSSGRLVQLDFTQSDLTIIDFWFDQCPPCIDEMKQFESLLKGKEEKLNVISISINRYGLWKSILQQPEDRFSFLSKDLKNWKHYNLQSSEDERLNNNLPMDNQEQLRNKLNVTFYPAYFIIDRSGIINARPVSAVDYIKSL
jgi:thiol-disulfide isomerase/thioredoxin